MYYYYMINPYNNNNLKFSLSDIELKLIDDVWEFINKFRKTMLTRRKYKEFISKKIKKNYTIDQFYNLEKIVEKMYWNLSLKIKKDIDIKSEIFLKRNYNLEKLKDKILKRNVKIKKSTIEKTFITTKNGDLLYKYNYPNDIDLLISSIIINRSIYETIMSEEEYIFNIEIEPYNNIVEFDYAFPNLNTIKFFTTDKNTRLKNISKMYYND